MKCQTDSSQIVAVTLCASIMLAVGTARAEPSLTATFVGPSDLQVQGSGFEPFAWPWLTYDNATDTGRIDEGGTGADANGLFTHVQHASFPCGRTIAVVPFMNNQPVQAWTTTVTSPPCAVPPPLPAAAPADPNASADVKSVLDALRSSTQRNEERLLIGQALRGWDPAQRAEPITALTDKQLPAPKLVEVDLTDFRAYGAELRSLLAAHVQLGGLVGLSSHAGLVHTLVDLTTLADPADPALDALPLDSALDDARAWRGVLNEAAVILDDLQAQGAVVLFRPLHESNLQRPDTSRGFWWSDSDPAQFKALWQGAFRYLTQHKNIHNALWVYAANRNYGGIDPTLRYPGDDYVDVVGLDIYHDELSEAVNGSAGYAAMVALGKPFAITEYGASLGANTPDTWHDGYEHLRNDKVIEIIKTRYPATTLASAWYSHCRDNACTSRNNWQISDKRDPAALLLDPWAITR